MFFTKYIKRNKKVSRLPEYISNFILSLLKLFVIRKKRMTDRVGIIALHRLGDAVFTIPAIKQIINHHGKNIYLICFQETTAIYNIDLRSVNFVELSHKDFLFADRIAKRSVKKKIRELELSIIYDLTGTVRSASLLFNYPAEKIIGLNEPFYRGVYTNFVSIRSKPHITDNYLDVIRNIIPVSSLNEIEYDNAIKNNYLLIHPFASVKSKEWGLNKYIMLADILKKKYSTAIVTPPDIISSDIIKEIRNKGIEVFVTKTTEELVNIIKQGFMLIGNDSGAVHIANLLGKPTFTIYGPTNPEFHKPLKGINDYIINKIKCSPEEENKFCFTHGGVYCPSNECMQGLTIDDVIIRIENFINRNSFFKKHKYE